MSPSTAPWRVSPNTEPPRSAGRNHAGACSAPSTDRLDLVERPTLGSTHKVFVARRPANLVFGIIFMIAAISALIGGINQLIRGIGIGAFWVVFAAASGFVAFRAMQASVLIRGSLVTVRSLWRSGLIAVDEIASVESIPGFDGPRAVRRVCITTKDGRLLRSHFQSPTPFRGDRSTAADRLATKLTAVVKDLQQES